MGGASWPADYPCDMHGDGPERETMSERKSDVYSVGIEARRYPSTCRKRFSPSAGKRRQKEFYGWTVGWSWLGSMRATN